MDVLYVTHERWMTCLLYMQKLHRQLQELPEDREEDCNAGNLPN